LRKIKAYLKISIKDKEVFRAIIQALEPEVKFKPPSERSEALLKYNESGDMVIEFGARDINALRAMVNAYLYLLHVATNTIEVVRRRISLG